MLYEHFSLAPWEDFRWSNFKPQEFACPHCGEFWHDPEYFDRVQGIRTILNAGFSPNSAHRCLVHNRIVGGAINSEHKRIAIDIPIKSYGPKALLQAALDVGFATFGFYKTFLHVDLRPGRRWITNGGKQTWNSLVTF